MNLSRFIRLSCVLLMAGAPLLFSGCASCMPARYNIEVSLHPSLKDSSMQVDLVGVNSGGLSSWEGYSMSSYWKPNDAKRRDALDKVTFDFLSGSTLSATLKSTDPVWNKWLARGVSHVVVLANQPMQTDKPGNQDARRQILPLDNCHWAKGTSTLKLLVQQSGIEILTPPAVGK